MMNKHIRLLLMGLAVHTATIAQDRIIRQDGTVLDCRIIRDDPAEILYQNPSDASKTYAIERPYVQRVMAQDVYYPPIEGIMVGIGTLIDTSDYTCATFDLFRYFADHPMLIGGDRKVRVGVVDRPNEAPFAITGLIESDIDIKMIGGAVARPNRYNYNVTLNCMIWRNGTLVKRVSANFRDYLKDANGEVVEFPRWPLPPDLKYFLYKDVYRKIQGALVEAINASGQGPVTVQRYDLSTPLAKIPSAIQGALGGYGDPYPHKTLHYFRNEGQFDPWEGLYEHGARYTVGLDSDGQHSLGLPPGHQYEGNAQLNFPVWIRPEAVFDYIRIGDNFARIGQPAMAVKCYNAALILVSKTFCSRPVKEKLRLLAYAGLNNVALKQGRTEQAALYKLATDLIKVYLDGVQARDDDEVFALEMENARRSETMAKQAERQARTAAWMSIAQTGMSIAGYANSPATSVTDVINSGIAVFSATESMKGDQARLGALQQEVAARLTQNYAVLKNAVGANVETTEQGGGDFLSKEVIFFLATSTSTEGYLRLIRSFSIPYPELQAAIRQHEEQYDPVNSILGIGEAIAKIERAQTSR